MLTAGPHTQRLLTQGARHGPKRKPSFFYATVRLLFLKQIFTALLSQIKNQNQAAIKSSTGPGNIRPPKDV